jgi:N-acetylglutamate synthase-like GNAT family acetyltransferase
MGLKQIDHGSSEYKMMVELRKEILRKPLGLDFSEADLENEKNDTLIAAFDDDEMVGCCMLCKETDEKIKLRQMAVHEVVQGKGLGAAILNFAENIARDKGYKTLFMHARESAVGFYEKLGYKINSDVFNEVNIPHFVMEKSLEV